MVMGKRVALYLRVSTSEQTIVNQRRELEAVAERHGWQVVAVFKDEGISGTKGRDKRPGFDRLCQGIARREFDRVAAWSVSEFEWAMIVERVKAGLSRARSQGRRLGRPSLGPDKERAVRRLLSKGTGIVKTAKTVGVGVSAVQRIKGEMNDARAA